MFWSKKIYPYGKQTVTWRDMIAVLRVLRSSWLTQGPAVTAFEQALCDYTGAQYAVVMANGTLALQLAVAALELPVGFEGITTPNTFVASANCILQNGGKVVFADIEPTTGNIDPLAIEKQISDKTRVIIPVHFAGQPCDMKKIYNLARAHNCFVLEDAAHAIGSRYDGNLIGSCTFSDMTMFSFHPVKTITSGEGAAITTNNKMLYERLVMLRTIGITKKSDLLTRNDGPWYYQMQHLSTNARMSDIHAALGLSQLKRIHRVIKERRSIVETYLKMFANQERFSFLEEKSFAQSAWHLWPLLINFAVVKKTKVQIFNELKDAGLQLQVHYIPVHTQPYYQALGFKEGQFPHAERYYQRSLSLPLYPGLSKHDLSYIAKTVKKVII